MANVVGSKGSAFNLAQIMGFVGQTFVNGARPSAKGTDRVLSNAPLPGEKAAPLLDQLRTQGLIARSYKEGLTMPEAFLHNMGGREGLVDTAAKTAHTGYLQRRTVKAVESHHIAYDRTVRNAYQHMFQVVFGCDGFDPCHMGKVQLKSLTLDDAKLRGRCVADHLFNRDSSVDQVALVHEWTELIRLRDLIRRAKMTNFQRDLSTNLEVYLPFDVAVLAERQKQLCHTRCTSDQPVITAAQAVEEVRILCQTLDAEVPTQPFTCYHVMDELGSKRLTEHWKLCRQCTHQLCQKILELHRNARLQPGEGIGAMTATSLGEPATQMEVTYVT